MSTAAAGGLEPAWEIRSDLPGRLRLRCAQLSESAALRRHCRTVLTGCHWLKSFRINALAGCLSLRFPPDRRPRMQALLELALTLPRGFSTLQTLGPRERRSQRSLRHAALCTGLLGLDWLVGLPLLALQGATALLMLPVVIELLHTLRRRRCLPVEALDLGFSAVLLQLGLPREALTDLALDDGSELLQDVSHSELGRADYRDLLVRIAEQVQARTVDAAGEKPIGQLVLGERIRLESGDPVFVACLLRRGSLVVINRQLSGDWHPHQLEEGDRLEPGCLVLCGEAELEVAQTFADCPLFQLPPPRQDLTPEQSLQQRLLAGQRIINPVLFGLGSLWALTGASERALAAFQFNPINDWETSRNANNLAAVTELRLHGIHIANPDALQTLGRMDRLLLSHSSAERLQPVRLREELAPGSAMRRGELVRLLAGLQQRLVEERSVPIWNIQLENVNHPIPVERLVLGELDQQGWQVELEGGRSLQVVRDSRHRASRRRTSLDVEPLEFREGDRCLGWVNLERQLDEHWLLVRQQLEQLGIAVEVVGQAGDDPDEAQRRLMAVEHHQSQGELVGYLGDVLHDIPALSRADLAIGLDFDEAGLLTNKLCDVSLNSDPQWLPRLVVLSRSLQRTADGNAWMIGLTHVLSSVATAGLAISPLQTVLLADLPLLVAELRNLNSFQSHTHTRLRPRGG